MKTNNLDYYLKLDYDVVISRRESEGGVSYKAYAKELDPYVFYGVGDTKQEALKSFEQTKAELFELYFEEGRAIPVPTRENDSLPSGQFVLRIDPSVHLRLKNIAKGANKSLNSYVDQVLIAHVTGVELTKSFEPLILTYFKAANTEYKITEVWSPGKEVISEEYHNAVTTIEFNKHKKAI